MMWVMCSLYFTKWLKTSLELIKVVKLDNAKEYFNQVLSFFFFFFKVLSINPLAYISHNKMRLQKEKIAID